ncbi:MAG: glutathione peroxidase [Prevotellaceae bacterium]|nr:glutathione peroxidase [Prevotellaceae bacterium]
MNKLFAFFSAVVLAAPAGAQSKASFYDLKFTTLSGKEYKFDRLKGKKVLIVNTASKCGFTKQYADLQKLSEKYADKLVIIGFPSNQFGKQEPGTNEEIGEFCQVNYGVTFQLMEKSDVKDENQNPVYRWLTDKNKNGWNEEVPSWNFCKYFVNEKGELIKFFNSRVTPMSEEVTKLIE